MLIGIFTSNYKEEFEVDITNLYQLKDYLANNKPYLWNEIKDKSLAYGVFDNTKQLKEQILLPNMVATDISSYSTLIITEKVEGAFIITAIAIMATYAVAASIALTGVALFSAAAAMWVIGIAIVYGIGQLIQMLSPTQKLDRDPSANQKNLLFNGIPNTKEQGGSVPLIFGECYFGGVQIGVKLSTVDYIVGKDIVYDELPRYTSVNGTRMEKLTGTNTYANTGNPYIQATWARVH